MKTRAWCSVSTAASFGLVLGFFLALAAASVAQIPGLSIPNRGSATAAAPARGAPVEFNVPLRGALSGTDENDDDEPDAVFAKRPFRAAPRGLVVSGATSSPATAGGSPPSDSTKGGEGTAPGSPGTEGGAIPFKNHPNAPAIIEKIKQALNGFEIDVALLGSHKYMINDCLGIKVSAGTFKLRFDNPKIYFQNTALIFECGIEKIEFSAIKLRMRPNPNILKPCKFSKKFEVGGKAEDIRLKLTMDPIVDLQHCKFFSSVLPEGTVRIGDLNLKPLQNNLDQMAKNAVEDALTAMLHFQFYDQFARLFDDLIEADCPGTDARRAIERAAGISGQGGSGGASGAGGAEVAALTQRVQALEARVAALEQPPAGTGGTRVAPPPGGSTKKGGTGAAPPQGGAPKTGPNYVDLGDNKKARPVTPSAPAPGREPVASKSGDSLLVGVKRPQMHESEPCCSIVPNAELKGRLGRIVVAFPATTGAKKLSATTVVFKAGETKSLRTDYSNVAVEMMPGTYELEIGGQKVVGVVVEARSDTVVKVGVLRTNGSASTTFNVFPAGGSKKLTTLYGENVIGLPIGDYEVEVNGQRERVTIREGNVTEY
ncbi:MAG: hypothetical protein JNK23_20610 [Opitutaceae bacterium]|nr:hypothetical protein [Opitutaceae bacterium]